MAGNVKAVHASAAQVDQLAMLAADEIIHLINVERDSVSRGARRLQISQLLDAFLGVGFCSRFCASECYGRLHEVKRDWIIVSMGQPTGTIIDGSCDMKRIPKLPTVPGSPGMTPEACVTHIRSCKIPGRQLCSTRQSACEPSFRKQNLLFSRRV